MAIGPSAQFQGSSNGNTPASVAESISVLDALGVLALIACPAVG